MLYFVTFGSIYVPLCPFSVLFGLYMASFGLNYIILRTTRLYKCALTQNLTFLLPVRLQEEQRQKAKQAKEDLEMFLLNSDKMNSTVKYWWVATIQE